MIIKSIKLRNENYIEYGFHLGKKKWFLENIYWDTRYFRRLDGTSRRESGYYGKPMIFFENRKELVEYFKKLGFKSVN